MKSFRFAVSAMIAIGGLALMMAPPAAAKPEDSKKEKVACTACHTKVKSKELNDTGKCYATKKSLAECKK